MPDDWPSIRYQCEKALYCRTTPSGADRIGICDVNVKVRRVLMSWIYCALDLWEAGVMPGGAYYIGAPTVPMAGGFVYREMFIFNSIAARYPEWGLAPLIDGVDAFRIKGAKVLSKCTLPNGSFFEAKTYENADAQFIADGARRVRLEEVGKARYPHIVMENAERMCTPPRTVESVMGGNITLIGTAMPGFFRNLRQPEGTVLGSTTP